MPKAFPIEFRTSVMIAPGLARHLFSLGQAFLKGGTSILTDERHIEKQGGNGTEMFVVPFRMDNIPYYLNLELIASPTEAPAPASTMSAVTSDVWHR